MENVNSTIQICECHLIAFPFHIPVVIGENERHVVEIPDVRWFEVFQQWNILEIYISPSHVQHHIWILFHLGAQQDVSL
jgi:hypothetical protein